MKWLQNDASKIKLSPYIYSNVKNPHWLPALQTLPSWVFYGAPGDTRGTATGERNSQGLHIIFPNPK